MCSPFQDLPSPFANLPVRPVWPPKEQPVNPWHLVFLWPCRQFPKEFAASKGSCGARRRATGRPWPPPTIPNYNLSSSNLFLIFLQRSSRRPCLSPKKGHQGTTSRKSWKDCTPSNETTTMSFPCENLPPPLANLLYPLVLPLKHFLKTLDTLFFSLFLRSSRRWPEDFVATTGSCGAQRRATGRSWPSHTIPNYNHPFFDLFRHFL